MPRVICPAAHFDVRLKNMADQILNRSELLHRLAELSRQDIVAFAIHCARRCEDDFFGFLSTGLRVAERYADGLLTPSSTMQEMGNAYDYVTTLDHENDVADCDYAVAYALIVISSACTVELGDRPPTANESATMLRFAANAAEACGDASFVSETLRKLGKSGPRNHVQFVNVTNEVIRWLAADPGRLSQLTPQLFEELVANRFAKMNFEVIKTGHTNQRDGGIDLLAYPHSSPIPFLLGIQVKQRRYCGSVGSPTVREFRGAIQQQPIDVGMIVTNAHFTPDATWLAAREPQVIRLRDLTALRSWIADQFELKAATEEMPETLELARGRTIELPWKRTTHLPNNKGYSGGEERVSGCAPG